MLTADSKSAFKSWCVVLSAALFFLFEYVNLNSFNALNADLRLSFHADALQISNLSAMYFYANVLFLIPAGLLLDRYSSRNLILLALCLSIIATYVFATTDSFTIAKTCRFITGMASTFCLLSTTVLTSRWFPSRKSALVMGCVVSMPMLGGTLAQQTGWLATTLGGWRPALILIASIGILFWFLIAWTVRDYPPNYQSEFWAQHPKTLHLISFWQSLKLSLKKTQVWYAGIYTQLLCLPVFILGALWGKEYLMVTHALSASEAELCSSLIFIGMLVGSPLQGWFSDHIGYRKWPMVAGGILTLVIMLCIMGISNLTLWSLYSLFFGLGFFSATQIITYALLIESSPSHLTGSTESVAGVIIMSSGAIFQPLFGYLLQSDWSGQTVTGVAVYTASDYQHALWLLPVAFAVSVFFALCIQETFAERQYA